MSRDTLSKETVRLIRAADAAVATGRQLCAERRHMLARLNRDAFVRLFEHDAHSGMPEAGNAAAGHTGPLPVAETGHVRRGRLAR